MVKLTEKEYRKIDLLSYSSLKEFVNNRKKFYKKYILKEPVDETSEDDNENLLLGSMVDALITLSDEEFEKKFFILNGERERGQMLELGNEIWKVTKNNLDEENKLKIDFLDIFDIALNNVKYDKEGNEIAFKGKKKDDILLKFCESKEKKFYDKRLENVNSICITMDDYNKAIAIKERLYNTEWTKDIVNKYYDPKEGEVIFQMIVFHNIKSVSLKSMIDVMHIHHDSKTIQAYDLKVSYFVNDFEYSFLKNKYYIQLAIYYNAIQEFKKKNKKYEDYKVLPIKFIVADSTNNFLPVIYSCTENHLKEAMEGFTTSNGKNYIGVNDIIDEIIWCNENNIWNCSKKAFLQNGEITINY
jgi:hypothetical protein